MMENLSKEYFSELRKKYPESVTHFYQWLEEYKEQVSWDRLFSNNRHDLFKEPHVEFFDLPYDMQNGILARFDMEKFHGKNGYQKIRENECTRYDGLFNDVQRAIENKSIKYN